LTVALRRSVRADANHWQYTAVIRAAHIEDLVC
jgi:hypothetical protein